MKGYGYNDLSQKKNKRIRLYIILLDGFLMNRHMNRVIEKISSSMI